MNKRCKAAFLASRLRNPNSVRLKSEKKFGEEACYSTPHKIWTRQRKEKTVNLIQGLPPQLLDKGLLVNSFSNSGQSGFMTKEPEEQFEIERSQR